MQRSPFCALLVCSRDDLHSVGLAVRMRGLAACAALPHALAACALVHKRETAVVACAPPRAGALRRPWVWHRRQDFASRKLPLPTYPPLLALRVCWRRTSKQMTLGVTPAFSCPDSCSYISVVLALLSAGEG